MRKNRLQLYHELEQVRRSKLLVYATSTREGAETQIAQDVLPIFTRHLDSFGKVDRISLYLYTNGGMTMAAWSLVNLIRSFCDDFEVIVPSNCFSSGTIICLGANRIVMTKQASLGPIDPSVNGPMNPQIPGTNDPNARVPVSVEIVKAYIDMAKTEVGINNEDNLTKIYLKLSDMIHPLTLGSVYRSKLQIQMLAKKLLKWQKLDEEKEKSIIEFLCSGSGSHDYSIHRDEARDSLGLPIEKPDDQLYSLINNIYNDLSDEMKLEEPFAPQFIMNQSQNQEENYSNRRGIIDSIAYGEDVFITEGKLTKRMVQTPPLGLPQPIYNNTIIKQGWTHEN